MSRRSAARLHVVTESDLEDLLVEVLGRFGLPAPVRQRNLGGLDDRVGRVDFLYAGHRLVIEADGRRNHTALLDRESDAPSGSSCRPTRSDPGRSAGRAATVDL